jgi:hypothetical protein
MKADLEGLETSRALTVSAGEAESGATERSPSIGRREQAYGPATTGSLAASEEYSRRRRLRCLELTVES